jgi:hypothetical protein
MNLGVAVFGVFCLVLVFAGVVFIVSVNAQQTPYTDTYGNTLSSTSNQSQDLVGNITTTGGGLEASLPLILIAGAIVVCMIVFCIYLAAKVFLE